MPLILLALQTVFFWLVVIFLYRMKSKFTLIPIYSYLAVLTISTHNLSDLGFSIVHSGWFFLIGSVSFFTTLMFIVLFLYLFEGPRALRIALGVILGASFLYIFVVYSLQFMADTSQWVQLNFSTAKTYFWSILAIIIDVFALAVFWELLAKLKSMSLFARVFMVSLLVFVIDTLIFTTGVFATSGIYISILKGNLLTRLFLSILSAPVITLLLRSGGFSESKRNKPQNFWEIFNFKSDLERKIANLEEVLKQNKNLTDQLQLAKDTYELVIASSGAAVWEWNLINKRIIFSSKFFEVLGYKPGQIRNRIDDFKALVHNQDIDKLNKAIDSCLLSGKSYNIDCRLKMKSGKFAWFLVSGLVQHDSRRQSTRMVGSIINIDSQKKNEQSIQEKIDELANLNNFMVNRELKMIELKTRIRELENKENKK